MGAKPRARRRRIGPAASAGARSRQTAGRSAGCASGKGRRSTPVAAAPRRCPCKAAPRRDCRWWPPPRARPARAAGRAGARRAAARRSTDCRGRRWASAEPRPRLRMVSAAPARGAGAPARSARQRRSASARRPPRYRRLLQRRERREHHGQRLFLAMLPPPQFADRRLVGGIDHEMEAAEPFHRHDPAPRQRRGRRGDRRLRGSPAPGRPRRAIRPAVRRPGRRWAGRDNAGPPGRHTRAGSRDTCESRPWSCAAGRRAVRGGSSSAARSSCS